MWIWGTGSWNLNHKTIYRFRFFRFSGSAQHQWNRKTRGIGSGPTLFSDYPVRPGASPHFIYRPRPGRVKGSEAMLGMQGSTLLDPQFPKPQTKPAYYSRGWRSEHSKRPISPILATLNIWTSRPNIEITQAEPENVVHRFRKIRGSSVPVPIPILHNFPAPPFFAENVWRRKI